MKLKRLIVQGFKSFKDRTVINFDHGITGIVGPNGCGKSNIVDALFWVMGEQSAKHLRGSSMQDLIFSGSSKYSPAHWAEVSLVLENDEKKHIHIGPKVTCPNEIQLTRKIYKNHETEYRINDIPCRLKDVQEVFMDTGAGAKSYSIIAQGEINRLVQAKPEERRLMIEEVAGITKFKKRRKESVKKIEFTQINLGRLNDLKQEIHKNLKALEKQAEKAERAKILKEKVKKYELITNSHKEYDLLRDLRDGQNFIREKKLEIEGWKTKKQSIEISLESEKLGQEEKNSELEEKQQDFNTLSKKLVGLEEKLNYLKISLQDKLNQIKNKDKENIELENELKERAGKLNFLQNELEKINSNWKDTSHLEEREVHVNNLTLEIETLTLDLAQKRRDLESNRQEKLNLDQKQFKNATLLSEYSAKLQDLTKETEGLEKQHGGHSGVTVIQLEEMVDLEKKYQSVQTQLENLQKQIEEKVLAKKDLDLKLKETGKRIAVLDSKLISLTSLRSKDPTDRPSGIYSISDLILCDEKYIKGVQGLLATIISSLFVDSDPTFSMINEWASANTEFGQNIISPLNRIIDDGHSESKERLLMQNLPDLVELSEVVQIKNPDLDHSIRNLFKGLYLCSNLDFVEVNNFPKDLKFKAFASFNGEKVVFKDENSLQYVYSSTNNFQLGAIEIENKILEVKKELEQLKNQSLDFEEKTLAVEKMVEEFSIFQSKIREEGIKLREDLIIKKASYESQQKQFESALAKLEILNSRKSEISKSKLSILEEDEAMKGQMEQFNVLVRQYQKDVDNLLSAVEEKRKILEKERQVLMEEKLFQKNFEKNLSSNKSQIKDIEDQLEKMQKKLAQNNEMLLVLKNDCELIEVEKVNAEGEALHLAKILQEKEVHLGELKEELSEMASEIYEREEENRKLSANINKTEKELIQYEVKIAQIPEEEDQLVRDIFDKYRVDLRKTLGSILEFNESDYSLLKDLSPMYMMETSEGTVVIETEDYTFNRRFGKDLKEAEDKFKQYKVELNRIGDINWQAINDYDHQKTRYDFLIEQEEELKKSLKDLELAIEHIDEKSRTRFSHAFKEVNERFEKVFPIIFGGGAARLDVVGNLNDPECGIEIHAQPPGKKMQNLNLMSGGEKAMTALSLIFSIFLVKPSPFCLLDEVDAPLDDANVGRFNDLLREMSGESQFVLITHNKKTMELNDMLYGITMQEPGISTAVSVQLH